MSATRGFCGNRRCGHRLQLHGEGTGRCTVPGCECGGHVRLEPWERELEEALERAGVARATHPLVRQLMLLGVKPEARVRVIRAALDAVTGPQKVHSGGTMPPESTEG